MIILRGSILFGSSQLTMKLKCSLLFALALFFVTGSRGQTEKSYDSVVVFQKNYKKNRFLFHPSSIQQINLTQNKPRRASYPAGEILEDIGRVGLTLFMSALWGESSEFTASDTDEVDWVLSSQLNYSIQSYNWNIQMFTKGIHYKEFSAYGESLDSGSDREVWWDENTRGVLLNQTRDTISRFVMLVYPDIDEVIQKMAPEDHQQIKLNMIRDLKSTFGQGGLFLWSIDYALIGKFRGEDFAIASSEEGGKFWIFRKGIVKAILQRPEKLHFKSEKKSDEYHLLIAKGNDVNQFDYLRLSMLYYYFRSNYE